MLNFVLDICAFMLIGMTTGCHLKAVREIFAVNTVCTLFRSSVVCSDRVLCDVCLNTDLSQYSRARIHHNIGTFVKVSRAGCDENSPVKLKFTIF